MAEAAVKYQTQPAPLTSGRSKGRYISWESFQKRYLNREDGNKYEWVRGDVVKTKSTMNQKQLHILANLRDFFNQLVFSGQVEGYLEPEVDTFFLEGEAHRRPDLSYFTKKQQALAANGIEQIPLFVIEVVSSNDLSNDLEDKLMDYWTAGVKVVWLIYPKQEIVYVHSDGKENSRCQGDDFCNAAPILPAFSISASSIFKKPPMPLD